MRRDAFSKKETVEPVGGFHAHFCPFVLCPGLVGWLVGFVTEALGR